MVYCNSLQINLLVIHISVLPPLHSDFASRRLCVGCVHHARGGWKARIGCGGECCRSEECHPWCFTRRTGHYLPTRPNQQDSIVGARETQNGWKDWQNGVPGD